MKCSRKFRASEFVQLLCASLSNSVSHFSYVESQMCKASVRKSSLCTLHLPSSMLYIFTFPDSWRVKSCQVVQYVSSSSSAAKQAYHYNDYSLTEQQACLFAAFSNFRPCHDNCCLEWYALLADVSLHSLQEQVCIFAILKECVLCVSFFCCVVDCVPQAPTQQSL